MPPECCVHTIQVNTFKKKKSLLVLSLEISFLQGPILTVVGKHKGTVNEEMADRGAGHSCEGQNKALLHSSRWGHSAEWFLCELFGAHCLPDPDPDSDWNFLNGVTLP